MRGKTHCMTRVGAESHFSRCPESPSPNRSSGPRESASTARAARPRSAGSQQAALPAFGDGLGKSSVHRRRCICRVGCMVMQSKAPCCTVSQVYRFAAIGRLRLYASSMYRYQGVCSRTRQSSALAIRSDPVAPRPRRARRRLRLQSNGLPTVHANHAHRRGVRSLLSWSWQGPSQPRPDWV
jgi:hypothetical protein